MLHGNIFSPDMVAGLTSSSIPQRAFPVSALSLTALRVIWLALTRARLTNLGETLFYKAIALSGG